MGAVFGVQVVEGFYALVEGVAGAAFVGEAAFADCLCGDVLRLGLVVAT
jgi:hypothetical protein